MRMRRMSRIRAAGRVALALASSTVALAGCKATPSSPTSDAGVAASGALTPEQAAQVLARVGGRAITLGEFEAALENMDQFDRMRYQSPERRKELLGEMIDVTLLADEAREKGYDQDPVTQQELREILRDAMLEKAREGVPTPGDIPVEEVRAYFEAHRADFQDPERRRVSAIVVATEAGAAATLAAASQAGPAQWGELVRARSIDAMARSSTPIDMAGDFGFVSPPGDPRGANPRVSEEVRAGVFDIDKVGDVLPRVVTSGGKYYILKLTSRTDAHDRTFEEAERQIRVKLAEDKIHAREEALLDDLRKEYPVKIDEGALAQVIVELPGVDGGPGAR
jgi:peptidyl-prolyl cis-trans isomerase C